MDTDDRVSPGEGGAPAPGGRRGRMPRRFAAGLAIIAAGAAVLSGLGWWSADARARYADAATSYDDARAAYEDAAEEARSARRDADEAVTLAARYTAIDLAPVVDAVVADPLERAAEELDGLDEPGASVQPVAPPASDDTAWPPALDEAGAALDVASRELDERADALEADAGDLREATDRVESAGDGLVAAVAASRASLEAANPSARNADLLAFRAAADAMATRVGRWDAESAAHVESYVAAAAVLAASNAAELQERAGGLDGLRRDVEAFARSIAGGVLLEFDWAPVVNGYGGGDSYGGWAAVPDDAAPQATISLSDSIARDWATSAIPRAVVVHEVGHAMSSKCRALFAPSTREESEAWATAWAIGMGYDGPGNGESLYGRPSAALIELAATCR
ncbi:hypothetical protein ACWEOH_17375 [Agromyces sp. NPDC004153]